MTISGETAPGVRTPVNASASAGYHFEMSTVDYAVLILTIIVLAIIIVSAVRNGVKKCCLRHGPEHQAGPVGLGSRHCPVVCGHAELF